MDRFPILLAEDDPFDIEMIQRAWRLAHIQYPLKIVRDGEELMGYLAGEGRYADRHQFPFPSLVLLDLSLPKQMGLDALSWIRQHPRLKALPVAILTSSKNPRDMKRGYALGINCYFIKPSRFDELVDLVKKFQGLALMLEERQRGMTAQASLS